MKGVNDLFKTIKRITSLMLCILTMMSMFTVNFSMVEAEEVSEIDFSSCRLLVGTNDSTIFADNDNILSAYNGVYLLKYSSVEETKLAYNDLLSKADFVNVDSSSFAVADDSIQDIESQAMSEDLNPISELAEADTTETMGTNVIAVIDTGSEENPNVIERVSMLGDDVTDDNGHGSDMISNIVSQNPNAQIISIKAMDANGIGTVSSIYAALQYAIEKNVSYINMSFVGLLNEETSIIKDVIQTAIDNGITVVGAAGNNGMDALLYVPGVVADAYIIGASDEKGTRLENSNYGDNVDYNVVATSTSEACALFTGYLSKNGVVNEEDVNNGLIFATYYVYEEQTTEEPTEKSTEETIVEVPSTETTPTEETTTVPQEVKESPVEGSVFEIAGNRDTSKGQWVNVYIDKGASHAWLGGSYYCNEYRLNGRLMFCLNPSRRGPVSSDGKCWAQLAEVGNENLRKAMYYFYSGDMLDKKMNSLLESKWLTANEANRFLLLHYACAYLAGSSDKYYGTASNDQRSIIESFANYIKGLENAPSWFKCYYVYPKNDELQVLLWAPPNELILKKVDATTDKGLKGAKLKVVFTGTGDGCTGQRVDRGTYTTGSDGTVKIKNFPPGNYELSEVEAPPGYQKTSDTVKFTVSPTSTKTVSLTTKFKNTSLIKLELTKMSSIPSINYNLAGAKYGVYTDKECKNYFGWIVTDSAGKGYYGDSPDPAKGNGNVKYVPKQNYWVKEIEAPERYTLDTKIYKFVDSGLTESGHPRYVPDNSVNGTNGRVTDDPCINLQLKKVSANPDITDGSSCYSLEGAVYGIYKSKAKASDANYKNKSNQFGTITTDKDGYGCYITSELGYGTNTNDTDPVYKGKKSGSRVNANQKGDFEGWFVRELTAPEGYKLDDTVYQLTDSGKVSDKGCKIYRPEGKADGSVSDKPGDDPVTVSIKKTDPITGEQIRLPNAIFKLEYYNSYLDESKYERDFELDTSKSGYTNPFGSSSPTRTWYIKTDSDGYADLDDDWIITSGTYKSDERYTKKDELTNEYKPVVPYGTLVVSEVVSPDPDKYKVSTVNYYKKVDEEGKLSSVRLNFEIPEPRVPSIDTVAVDNSTRSHTALVSANSSITDKITYVGLNPGETYTMKGYVVEKSTQTKYSSEVSKSFKAGADGAGTISLTHTFASDGSNGKATLVGKSVVAFAQVVDSKGEVICSHMDLNDSDQTVSYLGHGVITTKASFDVFEDLAVSTYHPVKLGTFNNAILDTVYGKGFGGNKRYNLYTMVFKVNNGVIGDPFYNETMSGPTPFQKSTVTTKADGSFVYTVSYGVDSSKIDNESYVAYEFLSIADYSITLRDYYKGNNVWDIKGMLKFFTDKAESGELSSYHADPKDADQTIDFVVPEITSNAYPRGSRDRKQAYISGNKIDTTIVETLELSKLNKGVKYAIAPYVYVVENGKRVPLPADIAEKVKVYRNNELISNNVEGGTFKLGLADAMYEGVYDGIFSFTSVSATQALSLKFDFSACKDYIKGKTITFGEELGYYDGEYCYSFAEHNTNIANVNNPIETNQTIDFIEATVTTKAISPDTDTHYAYALGNSIDVVDTVSMTGLIPGKNYMIVGWLVDKSTNTAIPNTRVTKVITASNESQSVDIPLSLPNPSKYSDVVVFEELRFADNQILATHKDITDKNQTITLLNPTIDTTASSNRTSEVHSTHHRGETVRVYDTVSLTGLIVGKQYTLEGQLVNKRESSEGYLEPVELAQVSCVGTDVSLSSDKKTASVVFTASAESQNLVVSYSVNSGKGSVSYVAVEDLLYQGNAIASHNDYNDDDQTVEFIGVGSLVVDKLDSFTGNKLGGVKFNLYSVDEEGAETLLEKQFLVNGNYSTGLYHYTDTPVNRGYTDLSTKVYNDMGITTPADQVGILTVEDLPEGSYKLVETQTLSGYSIDITEGISFNVVGGDTTELEVTNSPIFTDITLIKTDDNIDYTEAKPLSGAGFTLYSDKNCTRIAKDFYGKAYSEVTTDDTGIISFKQLKYDVKNGSVYYLKETKIPSGYVPPNYIIKVVIDTEGTVSYYKMHADDNEVLITDTVKLYDESGADYSDVTRIINKRGSVTLEKQDENGESIKDSEWNLYRVDGTTEELVVLDSVKDGTYRCSDSTKGVTTLATDDIGNLKIENLPLGDYYLVEVSSPDGHMPYGSKIEFSLTADNPDLVGDNKIVVRDNVKLIPNTGGQGNTIMFLSIPCLTIALIALALYKRKAKSVRNIY